MNGYCMPGNKALAILSFIGLRRDKAYDTL